MAENINSAEILADTISKRIEQLMNERRTLRRELARNSHGTTERDKAFVQSYQNAVIDNAAAAMKAAKLEHMLLTR